MIITDSNPSSPFYVCRTCVSTSHLLTPSALCLIHTPQLTVIFSSFNRHHRLLINLYFLLFYFLFFFPKILILNNIITCPCKKLQFYLIFRYCQVCVDDTWRCGYSFAHVGRQGADSKARLKCGIYKIQQTILNKDLYLHVHVNILTLASCQKLG